MRDLVKSKKKRLARIDKVATLGLDVYDALCDLFEEEEEMLDPDEEIRTRYWAPELVGVILRRNAVETWEGIANGTNEEDPDALLRGLGASPADRFRHETQGASIGLQGVEKRWTLTVSLSQFLRFLDHVLAKHVLPRLREKA